MTFRILLIEDDIVDKIAIERAVKELKAEIVHVMDWNDIQLHLQSNHIDCVILDYLLPGLDSFQILRYIKEKLPRIPVITVTGKGDENIAVKMIKAGADDYITKDDISQLTPILEQKIKTKDHLSQIYQTTNLKLILIDDREDFYIMFKEMVRSVSNDIETDWVNNYNVSDPPQLGGYDIYFIDNRFHGQEKGADIAEHIRKTYPGSSIFVVTGHGNYQMAKLLINRKINILDKDELNTEQLSTILCDHLNQKNTFRKLQSQVEQLDNISLMNQNN